MRRTNWLTVGCLAILIGLGAGRFGHLSFGVAATMCVLVLFLPQRLKYLSLAILMGLSLGWWRAEHFSSKLAVIHSLDGRRVSLEVKATQDAVYGTRQQLDFQAGSIRLEPSNQPIAGVFKISGFGPAMVYRGDAVLVSGKLHQASGSYQANVSYAKLQVTASGNSIITNFNHRFSAGMQSALPEPNASFGLGLLIGQRNTLPNDLYQQLIMVGLVHIVAVSGYNLTILVSAAGRLRLFSKYQRLVVSLLLIIGFLLMTGLAASIVRAAIVSSLSLWAGFYGRRIRPILILTFAAALTALINPFYVWGDPSWYLSFLAFSGILIIAPILSHRLFRRPPKLLAAAAIETFSAELMALPIIMLMFGQLSLIGLLANVLVVPLVPLAMLQSAIAALVGMLSPSLAGWVAWPANFLLTYMLDIVRWLSGLPGIFQRRSISLTEMLVIYSCIGIILFSFRQRRQIKTVRI